MDDQAQDTGSQPRHGGGAVEQPVRTRWTPKPEQILILESIFNSGMVNPPKDETVRIRKLLEKFGSVGDANVFYWFQNRRSRSRRRQRQIQANPGGTVEQPQAQPHGGCGIPYDSFVASGYAPDCLSNYPVNAGSSLAGSGSSPSSSCWLDGSNSDDFFSFSGQPGLVQEYEQNPYFCSSDASTLPYQSEMITVFINGVATEMGRGAVDTKAMFGEGLMLFHSSGIPVQVNEYGFLVQGLQHGESYFLVPRQS